MPNIGTLVQQSLQLVDPRTCPEPLLAQFVDIRTLNDPAHRTRLQDLRSNGCVVITDAISMRHPALQEQLRKCKLDAYETTLMALLAPKESILNIATGETLAVRTWFESDFEGRLLNDDPKCIRVSQVNPLRAWLRNEVPRAIPMCQRKPPGIWGQFNQFDRRP
jgi:hypothetical protein